MFDTHNKQDLTAKRLAEINRINWSDLPLKNAIVSGPKDGLKMAVFTDPDCPYCKRLEKNLQHETGIRIYTFLFPLIQLHPDAYEKSKSIWCAKDQHQAMLDVMLNGKTLPKATCKTPIDDNMKLAEKLNVRGTPTIFAENGRKFTGGNLKAWLQQGSK
jgi:thiol:disulfide interchange protein DsbC